MIHIRRVLCPTDLSDSSRRALDHATALAACFGATVHVLHVLPAGSEPMPPVEPVTMPPPHLLVPQPDSPAMKEVDRFLEPARKAGATLVSEVARGDPVPVILDRARSLAPDLLVMGSRERSGPGRVILGSVAEKVLREAGCSVLTVRSGSVAPGRPRRALCPIDFSRSSRQALQWAAGLSADLGARLEVLHVLEPLSGGNGASERGDALRKEAHGLLGRAISEVVDGTGQKQSSPIDRAVVPGWPPREIVGLARLQDVDLVVMGVHGHGVVDRMLFGSTVDAVVRSAPCPVLCIRGQPPTAARARREEATTAAGR